MNIRKLYDLKNHNIGTKYLIIAILALVTCLIISTSIMLNLVLSGSRSLIREKRYNQYAMQLIETSDFLTYKVYNYAVSSDELFYNEYMQELNVDKNREEAVASLIELGVTQTEEQIIVDTLALSNDLAEIELDAFRLVKSGKSQDAQKMIFSKEYEDYKNKIHNNYRILKEGIESRVENENKDILAVVKASFGVSVIVSIGTSIATFLLLLTFYKIKQESDIDQLTGLQNRNRYKENIKNLIESEPDKFGAMIFCDIDNLKFINDCYGHTNGDRYINATASVLKEFSEYKSVLARPSGDEFVVYIHGFDTQQELIDAINSKMELVKQAYFTTTLHVQEKIRFSTGISVYPTDTNVVDDLLKYSDYAMYKMKKTSKGEMCFYDKSTLDKTIFLSRNSGCLNEFLEKELLDFAMQPIVDANTFEIYGYEALMRPQIDLISSPFLLLELAKAESKLDKIERLVLKKMFEKINNNKEQFMNYKIFINSIADQVLSNDELAEYMNKYPDVLNDVVIEVTEQEHVDEDILKFKIERFKEYGALIALDDYGSGYSNESSLLSGFYDIIKIDMNIVRNIDIDLKRQEIVKSLMKVSEINNYKVLGEGVETEGEARALRELGVHLMQGYFFGKPDLEIKGVSIEALEMLKANN